MDAKYVTIRNKAGLLHEAIIVAVTWQAYKNSDHEARIMITDKPA